MKRHHLALLALIMPFWTSAAHAHASAVVSVTGFNVSQSGSGANFDGLLFGTTLAPGQSLSEQFSYTIKIVDDGLPAARTWSSCLPLSLFDCGPAPTGLEQVQVELQTFQDGRAANPYIAFSGGPSQTVFEGTPGQTGSFSGSFTLTETNTDSFGQWADSELLFAALWVDSSDSAPVPEPAAGLAMVAGLAWMRRRLHRASDSTRRSLA